MCTGRASINHYFRVRGMELMTGVCFVQDFERLPIYRVHSAICLQMVIEHQIYSHGVTYCMIVKEI